MARQEDIKAIILDKVSDLVINFMYYDRKEDETLPRGAIQLALKNNEITVDEIVEEFRTEIEKSI